MAFTEKVKIVIETVVESNKRQWNEIKNNWRTAEGAVNKAKAGFAGLGKAAGIAMGAVGAEKIAKKAVDLAVGYDKAALAAGKFSKATGMQIEEGSRWIEVADDMGVKTDTLTRMFSKMAVEIAKNPDKLAALGVEVAKNDQGMTDMSETLLNMIEALRNIEDPAQRSAAAMQMLGMKGGPILLNMANSSKDWREELDKVPDSLVKSWDAYDSAKDAKASVEDLKDSWDGLKATLGELLAGPLNSIIGVFANLVGVIGEVGGVLQTAKTSLVDWVELLPGAEGMVDKFSHPLSTVGDLLHKVTDGLGLTESKSKDTQKATEDLTKATEEATRADEEAKQAKDELNKAIEGQTNAALAAFDSSIRLKEANDRLNKVLKDTESTSLDQAKAIEAAAKAQAAANKDTAEAAGTTYDATQEQNDLIQSLQTLSTKASPEAQKQIQNLINDLKRIPPNTTATVTTNFVTTGTPTAQTAGASRGGKGSTVNVYVKGWNGSKVALGREVQRAVRAADRWAS